MAIFGNSKFIPVFLGKIVRNNFEWPFLAIPNLHQSFGKKCWKNLKWPFLVILNLFQSSREKLSEKIQNSHFWPFQIYSSLFGKNCWKKFGTAIFGHSKFIPVFFRKIVTKNSELPFLAIPNSCQSSWEKLSEIILNGHFWPFLIYTSLFEKNCQKKFGTVIFGHSEFFLTIFLYISV